MDMIHTDSLVDKESPIPAYQQIATDLMERIAQEEWSVGDRLPSENELAEYYGVARVTLRQAMSMLEKDHLIVKQQGRGIFVSASPKIFTQNIQFPSFTDYDEKSTNPIESKDVIITKIDKPEKHVIRNLKIDENIPVIHVQRLFSTKSIIIGLNRAWLPAHIVPDFETLGIVYASISKTLNKRYGYEITNIENFVESIRLNVSDAVLLNSTYNALALKIDSIHYFKDKIPIEYARTIWLSDYSRLHFNVAK